MSRTAYLLARLFVFAVWLPTGCCPPSEPEPFACAPLVFDPGFQIIPEPECEVDDDCEFTCRANGSCGQCAEDLDCSDGQKCNGRLECVPLDCTDLGCEAPSVCREATGACEIIDCVDINDPVCTGKNFLCAADRRCALPDDVTGCGGPAQRSPAGPFLTAVTLTTTEDPGCAGTAVRMAWSATTDRPIVDAAAPPLTLLAVEGDVGPTPEEETGSALFCDDNDAVDVDDVLEVTLVDQEGLRSNAFCSTVPEA